LDIATLRRAYRDGTTAPPAVLRAVMRGIADDRTEGIWTHVRPAADVIADAERLAAAAASSGVHAPLYGLPFAVKDNIDVAGLPTTVACPAFAYVPERSAPVVDRLIAAGAICVGKTNLDQFATGLVGVRSPYGVPPNPFDPRYVTGGSSSGSAAAVARGLVTFSLATDTAGSGRVPAAFNQLVGLKPSRGLLSLRGVVPACRSLDCVTVLSFTCEEAALVGGVCTGFDADDPYSRREADRFRWTEKRRSPRTRIGVPRDLDLAPCDEATLERFARAKADIEEGGTTLVPVDMSPFFAAGQLLYDGPWIAERLSGLETFVRAHPDAVLPVIRSVLMSGEGRPATDAFRGLQQLAAFRRAVENVWQGVDALLVPTAPGLPRIDHVIADPIGANARLGRYTTFANLLDLAAVAVPCAAGPGGLPCGVTFIGPWGSDAALLDLASAFHARQGLTLGATGWAWPDGLDSPPAPPAAGRLSIAVVGAHLSGMPLNVQLTERGAILERSTHTAPSYRLYALPDTTPPKPGLVRVAEGRGGGVKIAVEVWSLPIETVGSFVAAVRAPLAIGTVELEDGTPVHGFLCEAHGVARARDISEFGGWRAYVRGDRPQSE
jgi:allophanate hydrolase